MHGTLEPRRRRFLFSVVEILVDCVDHKMIILLCGWYQCTVDSIIAAGRFSGTMLACKFHFCHTMSSVCLSSVTRLTRVYCDKRTADMITRQNSQGSQLLAW